MTHTPKQYAMVASHLLSDGRIKMVGYAVAPSFEDFASLLIMMAPESGRAIRQNGMEWTSVGDGEWIGTVRDSASSIMKATSGGETGP